METKDDISFAEKKQAKDERDSLFADIESSMDPEWEDVEIPLWKGNGREFCMRGAFVGERTVILNRGFRRRQTPDGEPELYQTAEYVPLLIATCLHWKNPATGRRERVFDPNKKEHFALINKHSSTVTDPLVRVAVRLSGLEKQEEEKAKQDFLKEPETTGFDSELLETWE